MTTLSVSKPFMLLMKHSSAPMDVNSICITCVHNEVSLVMRVGLVAPVPFWNPAETTLPPGNIIASVSVV